MRGTRIRAFALSLCLAGCLSIAPSKRDTPIDQVPMYGSMNRSAYPDLKAADDVFIDSVIREFGSREKASDNFANHAFDLYRKDDLARAMARFNQAWLLNPSNPQVFWGFASVLHDRGDYCQAATMMDRAIELGISPVKGFLADAGFVTSRCALANTTLPPAERKRILDRSEELFSRSEREDPNKAYVYGTWAKAYRDQERYSEAWQMVAKQRNVGGKPDEKFLSLLRSHFPEPVLK